MLIIPAIDLLDGKIVRLKQGRYNDVTIYHENPPAFAEKLKKSGHRRLHVVDLNGARDGKLTNLNLIREIADRTGLEIQTGGGIRSFEDIQSLLESGFQRVISSSLAVKKPEAWLRALDTFSGERCIFGMDLKNGKIATGGWLETGDITPDAMLRPMIRHGLKEVLCTDISRDGMMTGPNSELYIRLQQEFPELDFIASGGISSNEDLKTLEKAGLFACVVGRAWLEGNIRI